MNPPAPPTPPPRGLLTVEYVDKSASETSQPPVPNVPGYEILEELGRGGMGIVYKARQTKLNRLVALKMILAGELAGEQELARFRLEAEAVARLQHPHIVQIHEIGEASTGPFFSLELVEGGSLDKKINGTPLPGREAAQLVGTLARAMHAAHEHGIIHRDLKPQNVMLTAAGQPKITDFGLAKKLDEAKGQTQSGAIVGTPSYMAPEQAGGKKEIGPAADIYALGAILYELLTGRPPFKAETPLDTVLQVLTEEPVPPKKLNGKAPRDLGTICLKCLQKDPRNRYASAELLAEDIQRFEEGRPILARPVGKIAQMWVWCRRNRVVASLLAVVTLLLILLPVVALIGFFNTSAALEGTNEEKGRVKRERDRVNNILYNSEMLDGGQALVHLGVAGPPRIKELVKRDYRANSGTDPRDWEWHFLKRITAADPDDLPYETRFDAHGQGIPCFRINQDVEKGVIRQVPAFPSAWSREISTTSLSKRLDALRVPMERTGIPLAGSLSADGHWLAIGNGIKISIVNLSAGRVEQTLSWPSNFFVLALAWSPNGRRLASSAGDGVRIWDTGTWQETFYLPWGDGAKVGWSPDGHCLAISLPGREGGAALILDGTPFFSKQEEQEWAKIQEGHGRAKRLAANLAALRRSALTATGSDIGPADKSGKKPSPYKIAGALEGENLKILKKSGDFFAGPQSMVGFNNGKNGWSGDSQLLVFSAKQGAWLDLELPIAAQGKYHLLVHLTKASDYGIIQFSLDDKPLGKPIDCFHPDRVLATGAIDLGTVELKKGTATLRGEVVGTNPRSKGLRYMWGLDCVILNAK